MKKIKKFTLSSSGNMLTKEQLSNVFGGTTGFGHSCAIHKYVGGRWVRTYQGYCVVRNDVQMCVAVDNSNIYAVGKCM